MCEAEYGVRYDHTCGGTRVDVLISAVARAGVFVTEVLYTCV